MLCRIVNTWVISITMDPNSTHFGCLPNRTTCPQPADEPNQAKLPKCVLHVHPQGTRLDPSASSDIGELFDSYTWRWFGPQPRWCPGCSWPRRCNWPTRGRRSTPGRSCPPASRPRASGPPSSASTWRRASANPRRRKWCWRFLPAWSRGWWAGWRSEAARVELWRTEEW